MDYRPWPDGEGAESQNEGRSKKEKYVFPLCILVPPSSGDIINIVREDKTDHGKTIQQKSELVTDLIRGEKNNHGGW